MSGETGRARVALVTECSMSANVAVHHPEHRFRRVCGPLHMKRSSCKDPPYSRDHAGRGDDRPARPPPARRAVERMLTCDRRASALSGRIVIVGAGVAGLDDGAGARAAPGRRALQGAPRRPLWSCWRKAAWPRRSAPTNSRACTQPTRSPPATRGFEPSPAPRPARSKTSPASACARRRLCARPRGGARPAAGRPAPGGHGPWMRSCAPS